jgi:hypothetical protein
MKKRIDKHQQKMNDDVKSQTYCAKPHVPLGKKKIRNNDFRVYKVKRENKDTYNKQDGKK